MTTLTRFEDINTEDFADNGEMTASFTLDIDNDKLIEAVEQVGQDVTMNFGPSKRQLKRRKRALRRIKARPDGTVPAKRKRSALKPLIQVTHEMNVYIEDMVTEKVDDYFQNNIVFKLTKPPKITEKVIKK